MQSLTKPPKLKAGDKIAVVSLSWGGPGAFPERFEVGKQRLESEFGLEVRPSKHALRDPEWVYQNPQARAEDLMEAFLDPYIKGIFSSIGGDDSIRLLPFMDLKIIAQNPKIFLGFSDTTVTHFACLKAGLRSFYGPAVMTTFAENVEMHQYSIEGIKRTLFADELIGDWPRSEDGWTKEVLGWENPTNQNIKRKLNPSLPWNFIGAQNTIQGRLIGGCVEALQFLNGTPHWPDLGVWADSILFLETSEEGPSPTELVRFLRNLAAQRILEKVKGILFSKPGGKSISAAHFVHYDEAILKALNEYNLHHIPLVTQMDFGHSDPMWILPYGALIEINPFEKAVRFLPEKY
ncbi:LD-carboxypeptidase [Candidatus Bealeia paramacronuclearis]|uniref:LD-carboxypeptidase n=1 Tax=Candidatus Bealeia paramacronuclearis TaxID=1921001 RepID=A0ABZ2C7P5_9PROT|nr:LD-carboxypeptidase [Candidatus Bealeia paramacronuclearis]